MYNSVIHKTCGAGRVGSRVDLDAGKIRSGVDSLRWEVKVGSRVDS